MFIFHSGCEDSWWHWGPTAGEAQQGTSPLSEGSSSCSDNGIRTSMPVTDTITAAFPSSAGSHWHWQPVQDVHWLGTIPLSNTVHLDWASMGKILYKIFICIVRGQQGVLNSTSRVSSTGWAGSFSPKESSFSPKIITTKNFFGHSCVGKYHHSYTV